MNIRAISSLEQNYNLKATNKVNIITPTMKDDVVEITSNTLSFKGVDKKGGQGYRKLAKSHSKAANEILKSCDTERRRIKCENGMLSIIAQRANTYKKMAMPQYETAKALLTEVQLRVENADNCGDFTFSDGSVGRYIRFEQDGKKGLTVIKPQMGVNANIYEPTVATMFGEKLTITTKTKDGLERVFTFGEDGNLQKFVQSAKSISKSRENLEVTYSDGQMSEYKIKDDVYNNHYQMNYVCENGRITKVYESGYVDAKGCLYAGGFYLFEDENKPVLLTGYKAYQNGSSFATEEYTFDKVDDAYKLSEFKFRMSQNPEGKVEAGKIYKYQNDKLASMSIGQFILQNGQEVTAEYYVCDANGKPQEVLLNTKFDENSGEIDCCDKQISLGLSSKIAEMIEDFKLSW